MACEASDLALASSSSPAPKLMRARIIAKLPAPRGNPFRSALGVDAMRRRLRSSPGARRSKLPWSSAHDQPDSVSATPSVSETNGTTSSAEPTLSQDLAPKSKAGKLIRIRRALLFFYRKPLFGALGKNANDRIGLVAEFGGCDFQLLNRNPRCPQVSRTAISTIRL